MSQRVAVIGEGVIDRFLEGDSQRDVIGGSSLNAAVALKRAGVDADWWGRMSSGPEGTALVAYAVENGVGGRGIVITDEPASIVTIRLDAAGVPYYLFALQGAADWGWLPAELTGLADGYAVVQLGSLTAVLEPGSSNLLAALRQLKHGHNPPLISYDPNARPSAAVDTEQADFMRRRVLDFVSIANLVKVSDEDLEWLSPSARPYETALHWSTIGPDLVVMTQGGSGAVAFRNGTEVAHVSGVKVDVVDTVGAGDTFMAWLLRGIVADHAARVPGEAADVTRLLGQAAAAAAITCSRKGCVPPFASEVLG